MEGNSFSVYQLKDGYGTFNIRSVSLKNLKDKGETVKFSNYKHLYTGKLDADAETTHEAALGFICGKLTASRPKDFTGHPLTMSDVIVLRVEGDAKAFYMDVNGFKEVPEFMDGPYKYYFSQHSVDIGTYPLDGKEPPEIEYYQQSKPVEYGRMEACGALMYSTPLTTEQMKQYKVLGASSNPDRAVIAIAQFEEQMQTIGEFEKSRGISPKNRKTWWYSDFGVHIKYPFVTHEQVTVWYDKIIDIMASKKRAMPDKAAKRPKRNLEWHIQAAKEKMNAQNAQDKSGSHKKREEVIS